VTALTHEQALARRAFARLVCGSGGRVPTRLLDRWGANLHLMLSTRLSSSVDDARLGRVYDSVHFDFVNDASVNAFAAPARRRNFIGLNAGAAPILGALSAVTMDSADVWPELSPSADPGAVKERLRKVVARLRGEPASLDLPETGAAGPGAPLRRRLRDLVFLAAASFLVHHELAHIVRGHVDVLAARGAGIALYEGVSNDQDIPDGRLRRWMELDADRFGILYTLDFFEWSRPWSRPDPTKPERFLENPRVALRALLLGISLVLVAFDHRRRPITDEPTGTHPHPSVRLANLIVQIRVTLEDEFGAPARACRDVVVAALRDLDRVGKHTGIDLLAATAGDQALVQAHLREFVEGSWEAELKAGMRRGLRRVSERKGARRR
jgi:hypothetical protein